MTNVKVRTRLDHLTSSGRILSATELSFVAGAQVGATRYIVKTGTMDHIDQVCRVDTKLEPDAHA